jgi:hypothetical protein
VVLFDPATIIDRSTYDDPHQYPAGIGTVIVNGTVVIDGGEHTGALPGRLLRRRERCWREAGPPDAAVPGVFCRSAVPQRLCMTHARSHLDSCITEV